MVEYLEAIDLQTAPKRREKLVNAQPPVIMAMFLRAQIASAARQLFHADGTPY